MMPRHYSRNDRELSRLLAYATEQVSAVEIYKSLALVLLPPHGAILNSYGLQGDTQVLLVSTDEAGLGFSDQ